MNEFVDNDTALTDTCICDLAVPEYHSTFTGDSAGARVLKCLALEGRTCLLEVELQDDGGSGTETPEQDEAEVEGR
jgi:hypothetical protein